MKKILLISVLFSSATLAQNKINRDYFINLLKEKKYGQVFSEAMSLRENKVYGKCPVIDYFIAKSLCLDNYPEKGNEWLEFILQYYTLSPSNRKFFEEEMQSCRPVAFNTSRPLGIYNIPLPSASVYARLKGGSNFDCNSDKRKIQFGNEFSEDDLEARLFELDQKEQAMAKIKSLITDEYEVHSLDRYVLVSLKSVRITQPQVLDIATSLEKAYAFYVKYFGLRPPDKVITVYLMPDDSSLYKTAKLIHGASLPANIYGYSLLTDLSLLGIADPDKLGTLYHELFHLIVRTDLGDIPAWLDEGLASLYSDAFWKNDTLFGNKNTWRNKNLQKSYLSATSQTVPLLAKLFSYNWQQFNGGEDVNLCQASINYAVANHLMIYFQQQNILQDILNAYKKRKDPGGKDSSIAPGDTEILESALGYSVDSLQNKFTRWFISTYDFNLFFPGGDRPPGTNEVRDGSAISDYKNAIRRMLNEMKAKPVPAAAGVKAFEKSLDSIDRSYTKIEKKLQGELEKWKKVHPVKEEKEDPGQQVRQQAVIKNDYPPPTGAAKEKIDAYQKAMDNETAKMRDLYIQVTEVTNRYLHATKKR